MSKQQLRAARKEWDALWNDFAAQSAEVNANRGLSEEGKSKRLATLKENTLAGADALARKLYATAKQERDAAHLAAVQKVEEAEKQFDPARLAWYAAEFRERLAVGGTENFDALRREVADNETKRRAFRVAASIAARERFEKSLIPSERIWQNGFRLDLARDAENDTPQEVLDAQSVEQSAQRELDETRAVILRQGDSIRVPGLWQANLFAEAVELPTTTGTVVIRAKDPVSAASQTASGEG
jgi:hypothetical protein